MMFRLTNEEKIRIQKLAKNKNLMFALKKLFLNNAFRDKIPPDVQILAAERIAIDIIQDTFKQIEAIAPEEENKTKNKNYI